jgi:hypothetical protein
VRGDLTQIPKFGIVLVVVLVLGALGFRDRKETDVLQLICSVSLIAKRSRFSRTTTTPQIRNLDLSGDNQQNVDEGSGLRSILKRQRLEPSLTTIRKLT